MSKAQETYEAVEVMLASGQATDKQTAFVIIAEQTSAKVSNVRGNYYRHAKKIEAPLKPHKRRARSGPKAKPQAPREAIITNDLPPATAAAINEIVREVARLQAERNAQAALIEEMRRLAG